MSSSLDNLLRGTSSPIQRILITGASGWVGRETVSLLQPIFGEDFPSRVTLAGSRDAIIVVNQRTHHVKSLYEIDPRAEFDLIIHLAFLTQEKVETLGAEEFTRQVKAITTFMQKLCVEAKPAYLLVASSGAANPKIWAEYTSESKRVYGALKREAEEAFLSLSDTKVEIVRIWSISGSHIQNFEKYALGDFIKQVKQTGNIELVSSKRIERAYVDAGQMMEVLLLNLLNGGTGIIDSGGCETSLANLAQLTLAALSPKGLLIAPEPKGSDEDDIYVPDVRPFNALAESFGVELDSLEEQIQTTAQSFR